MTTREAVRRQSSFRGRQAQHCRTEKAVGFGLTSFGQSVADFAACDVEFGEDSINCFNRGLAIFGGSSFVLIFIDLLDGTRVRES